MSLVILLFLDAARIDIRGLLRRHSWPLRTLIFGMPLAFLGGTLVSWLLFPTWPLAVAALIVAILVPTDEALGQLGLIVAQDRGLTSPRYEVIATLSLAAAAYFAATAVGGNGFIAAFCTGHTDCA